MRKTIINLIDIISKTLPVYEPIYEFGALQVPGQEAFTDIRAMFPDKKYFGCDMRMGPRVDLILNLHNIDLPSETASTVIALDTFEHVEYPYKAMAEIYRILKPDGMVILSSVMNFPIHDYPYDYWRYTPEAFKSLLKQFEGSFIGFAGKESFPHTVVGIGFKGKPPELGTFIKEYEKWKNRQKWSMLDIALSITPPLLLPIIARIGKLLLGKNRF